MQDGLPRIQGPSVNAPLANQSHAHRAPGATLPLCQDDFMIAQATVEKVVKPSRVAAVDGLRGLLALVVLFWHATMGHGPTWMLIAADVAVAVFFLLSGYVLTRGWRGRPVAFLARRFVRLWPVYALCLGAGYLIAGVHPVWSEFLWYPILDADATPWIDPPIWSLFIEAWAMPFMPLIVWAATGPRKRAVLCVAALIAAGAVDLHIPLGALFVAGAFLARTDYRNGFLESAIPQWLGKISYSLYLTHWLVLEMAVRLFGPLASLYALPVVFAVAWLVWQTVERPSIWAARRIGRSLTGVAEPCVRAPSQAAEGLAA
jgi:peptidoglycan/LPS O-acetylase OafA/YrhL